MSARSKTRWVTQIATIRDVIWIGVGGSILIVALWWLLSQVGNVVFVLIVALILEITLSPLVDWIAGNLSRPWAVLIVVSSAILAIVLGGVFLLTVITTQLVSLITHLVPNVQQFLEKSMVVNETIHRLGLAVNIHQIENKFLTQAGQLSTFIVAKTVVLIRSVIDGVVDGFIIIFILVYLLLDAHRIQRAILQLVPHDRREGALAVEHTLSRVIGGYVRSQFLLSLIVGMAFGLGSSLIGLPFGLVIGTLAAAMELIPMLGPVLGAILPV
ncbi:MAG: AI-2E family transporter, partial [Firmicutes bacterium]|nr:AI-2E family transporter [Bacillota bacterium]